MATRRGVLLVMFLVGFATLVSACGLLTLYVLLGREPDVGASSALLLRVRGTLAEDEAGGVLGQFFAGPPTVRAVVDSLRKAKVDPRIKAVVLLPSGTSALWGKLQEIRDAVIDFKRSGKPIVAHLEYGGDQEYFLATACDKVFLMPASPLDVSGVATYELFLRGTLDKVGAYPDMLHIGDYKTATNLFTETTFTPAHREMTESLNADIFGQLVHAIAEGRGKTEADVRALLDDGPFLPEEAARLDLVDDLAYEDEVDEKAKLPGPELGKIESDVYRKVSLGSLGLNRGQRIAVIYAVGPITSGESRYDPAYGRVVGSDTLVEHIRKARDDKTVKAIVLRIDSPGGSAIATEVIWRELVLARNEKPLVASMSDLAASGGYYIAMPAQTIVAQPGTLTGSIGIYAGKITIGEMLKKLGANVETVSNGRNAELASPVRPFSAGERAKLEEQIRAFYDQFIEKAAQARRTTPERIDAVGQGRVWTGKQAKQIGLVDELGGLALAISLAKQRAGIASNIEVEVVVYPPGTGFYQLMNPFGSAGERFLMESLSRNRDATGPTWMTAPVTLFRRGEPLALMPYSFLR